MLNVNNLTEAIEELSYIIENELGRTNSHLTELGFSTVKYDVVIHGSKSAVSFVVYEAGDTDRLRPILRFKHLYYPSIKYLSVVREIWKFTS